MKESKGKFKGIKKPKKGAKMECCLNSVKCEFKGFEFSCMAREYNSKNPIS